MSTSFVGNLSPAWLILKSLQQIAITAGHSSHTLPRKVPAPFRVDATSCHCTCKSSVIDVIKSIRHKGLRKLFETGDASGIRADHRNKLRAQLAALDSARTSDDLHVPGYRLHALKGDRVGYWSIRVSGNWRLTFRFASRDVLDLDYEDYH
jgi:proteic killer suppression protein